MGQTKIYRQGVAEITVSAAQSIAISNFGGGIAKIYYLIETPAFPDAWQLQQTLEDSSVTLGTFSVQTIVKIEAGNSIVVYDVGTSPDTGIGDADTLNGLSSDTSDTASTIAARDASGDIAANAFESTVATGTAPLTIASTTIVNNLNADQTDGYDADETDTASTLAARDSSGDIQANAFESTVATGTAPLTVASTTVVPNLNADTLDGQDGSYYATDSAVVHTTGNETIAGIKSFSSDINMKARIISDVLASTQVLDTDAGTIYFGNTATILALNGTSLRFYDTASRTIWHSGNNPSVGAGNGVTGSFTTADAKTITVTNGIITAIA
jgi:hypothetical protein